MGQPITAVQKPSAQPGVLRFELNRSLTGMGHEHYRSIDDTAGDRPCDVLARRIFEHGGIDGVAIFSNMVTVDLHKGSSGDGLLEVIEQLFIHYTEGVTPSLP